MRLKATSYFQTDQPSRTLARLYITAWLVDDDDVFVPDPPQDPLSIRVLRNDPYGTVVRQVSGLLPGTDGFYTVSLGIHWGDEEFQYVRGAIRIEASSSYGTIYPHTFRAPYASSVWGAVYLDSLKFGVIAMTDQSQSLDVIANRIYDSIRQGVAVVPGESNNFCEATNPASGGSWGTAVSFGFESVAFSIYNYGDITVEFSTDGVDRHGIIPAYKGVIYDSRRATQIFVRAADSTPEVIVEAW